MDYYILLFWLLLLLLQALLEFDLNDISCPFFFSPVTDVELKRLKDAFKRTSGITYYMTQQCFYREVLGDGVPHKVAEVRVMDHLQ